MKHTTTRSARRRNPRTARRRPARTQRGTGTSPTHHVPQNTQRHQHRNRTRFRTSGHPSLSHTTRTHCQGRGGPHKRTHQSHPHRPRTHRTHRTLSHSPTAAGTPSSTMLQTNHCRIGRTRRRPIHPSTRTGPVHKHRARCIQPPGTQPRRTPPHPPPQNHLQTTPQASRCAPRRLRGT